MHTGTQAHHLSSELLRQDTTDEKGNLLFFFYIEMDENRSQIHSPLKVLEQ